MSSPYGMAAPPAILIEWSSAAGQWVATAVMSYDPIDITGPSSSIGITPSAALDELLTRGFCKMTDDDCPATMVSVKRVEHEGEA